MVANELELVPGRFVGSNHPVFIVAEIGQNHQGKYFVNKYFLTVLLLQIKKFAGPNYFL